MAVTLLDDWENGRPNRVFGGDGRDALKKIPVFRVMRSFARLQRNDGPESFQLQEFGICEEFEIAAKIGVFSIGNGGCAF